MKSEVLATTKTAKCKLIDFKSHLETLKNNKTILMCLFLTVLYLISGYWKWLEIAVSVCAIVFMAIIPLQSAFCIFMYMHCFTLSNIGYDSCFMVTLIGFCLILAIKYIVGVGKGKYEHHKKIIATIMLFYMIFSLFSIPYDFYRGAWLYLTYLPISYLIFTMRDEFDIKQGMNFLFGGMILSCALGFLFDFLPGFQYTAFHNTTENRFRGLVNHTNYLSLRAVFILSYYMYRFLDEKMNHIDFATTFFICSGITILTKSKTGICLLALLSLTFIILCLKKDFAKNVKFVLIFVGVGLLLCGIFYKQIWDILKRFGSAFTSENFLGSLLTGRDEIWERYFNSIFSNFRTIVFGHGLLAQQLYIPGVFTNYPYVDTHSFYIFLLYRFGLLGTIWLIRIIYSMLKNTFYSKPKFIACLPLAFMLLESFCDNTFKCYNICFFIFAVMIMFATQKDEIVKLKKANEEYQKSKEEKKQFKRKQITNNSKNKENENILETNKIDSKDSVSNQTIDNNNLTTSQNTNNNHNSYPKQD